MFLESHVTKHRRYFQFSKKSVIFDIATKKIVETEFRKMDQKIVDLNLYIESGKVIEIKKEENRQNPLSVITLAKKICTDGIRQRQSNDLTAPNISNGKII